MATPELHPGPARNFHHLHGHYPAKGSRPAGAPRQRYSWAYLFGAICPARGVGAGLVLPVANGRAMNEHLAEISRQVAPGAHAVVTLDGAGWYQPGGKLRLPENIRTPRKTLGTERCGLIRCRW